MNNIYHHPGSYKSSGSEPWFTVVLKSICLIAILQIYSAASLNGQCRLLDETFVANPVLSATNVDGTWYPDRYRPAGFVADAGRLKLSISAADGAQLRPAAFSSQFYNTHGRKFNQCGKCVTVARGELYIPADWATNHRRSDMWATAFDATDVVSAYPIAGFRNTTGSNPNLAYWDGAAWVELGAPATYDTWYTFEFRLAGANLEYLINNVVVGTISASGSVYFGEIIMQAYNFNDNTLTGGTYDPGPNNSYDAFWDNVVSTGTGGKIVTNTNTGLKYCSVQSAVNAAVAGNTLLLSPGTFNERVVVDKSLTIQGTTEAASILSGTGLAGTGKGITINTGVTNVEIENLTVQNFAGASGNTDGGIYAVGGNNNLLVEHVTIQNNVGGSGFYANGPVNNVTLDYVTSSGHTIGARGIVIWNGFKENVTITNCTVFNNNCCGIELQDGTASGVTMQNNNVYSNGDNGMGLSGLQGPGANVISMNTLTNNGRFGMEIKNPSGSGATSGPGSIVVENNTVTRNIAIGDARDIVGIAAFRRGVLAENVDVPTGVVIQNNTVSGYTQPSTSEGFGIVAEGTNHTIANNTVNGCDVGIQRQAGHTPYPGDGDQSNLADTYFGRGNSPVACGIEVSGNTLANTIDTRDVPASIATGGSVYNTTSGEYFCTIQAAINDAQTLAGHTLEVSSGTYNEQVLVTKGVTIKGVGAPQPVINFTGSVTGKPTLFDVSADGATIENLHFNVNMATLRSAVIASATGLDNITVKDNVIDNYGTAAGSYGDRNAVSINYSGSVNYRVATGGVNNVTFTGNTVNVSGTAAFRSGISADEVGGTFSGNTLQTVNHDILVRFGSNGNITVSGNTCNGGGVELTEHNAGAGTITVSGNTFDATFSNMFVTPRTAVLRLKNNQNNKTTNVTGNIFNDHLFGVSVENYPAVTFSTNTFTPLAGATDYVHIGINTKSLSSNSNTIVQTSVNGTLTQNIFNGSGTPGGTAVGFYNHDSDNAAFGAFTIGGAGVENEFNTGIAQFIRLDNQTGSSNGATTPTTYPATSGWPTTMACWNQNYDIRDNKFDVGSGLQLPSAMNFANRTTLETLLFHQPDAACTGRLLYFQPVHNLTQNTYSSTIQSAIAAAAANDVLECAEYTYNERVVIDKPLTLQGVSEVNCVLSGTGLVGTGKGITINTGVTGVTIKNLTVQNFAGSSGNADGGIYAVGGNNNLSVEHVTIQNNVGGSGFYANGPVNNVTLDYVTSSGHTIGARGIVIWNGFKENVTITNCTVFNNNCCGIELQDGTASGVTMQNNNVYSNGDNGMGLSGLQGPGANVISMNTLTNNGRFGMEIKNPNGSGATSGAGSIVVENNTVTRNIAIGDARDIVGIAAFRRGVLPENVDVPTGVVIQNNTVSGYTQPSTSEGFGIVAEGTNHTIANNTVNGCDVGIQRQAGHTPYPGDGDQSNLADTYFGRGNSPVACGIEVIGNTLVNTIDTRDVPVTIANGGSVHNTTSGEYFCTIQSAINDAQTLAGHTLEVSAGLYAENVIVNKSVTILGPNAGIDPCSGTRVAEAVVVPATSAISTGEIFHVAASNVTISGLTIDGDNTALTSTFLGTNGADMDAAEGVTVYETGINNLTVNHNILQNLSYFGVTLYDYPAGVPSTGHVISNNKFQNFGTYDAGSGVDYWGGGLLLYNNQYAAVTNNCMTNVRLGIQTGNYYQANPGTAASQLIDGNTMQVRRVGAFHNLHYSAASPFTFSNNTITGLANVNETGVRGFLLGSLSVNSTLTNNTINLSGVTTNSTGYEVWNVKNTTPAAINGGTVTGVNTGLFLNNFEGYNTDATDGAHAAVAGVTITPNAAGTGIRVYDSPSSTHAPVSLSIGSGVTVTGGTTSVSIDGANAAISSVGNLALNTPSGYYFQLLNTAMDNHVLDASNVVFDVVNPYRVADRIFDALDNGTTGLVLFENNNLYVSVPGTGASDETIPAAVAAAPSGDVINLEDGTYPTGANAASNEVSFALGSGPGCVTLNGNMVLTSGDGLNMELNGTTACSQYDQFTVNGTVTLGNASLNLTLGFVPVVGNQFVLINNDGVDPVVGQFVQGNTVIVSGTEYTIFYNGGDGNDVVLKECVNITGNIVWENNLNPVKNVTVNLLNLPGLSVSSTTTTDMLGNYTVPACAMGNYRVKPSKTGTTNGLTSADATRIQQHVVNNPPLTGPYKRIAADVNKSNSITTYDATLVTQVLLNNPAANAVFNTAWRFVPATYTFPNPNVPWGFPEHIDLTGVSGPVANLNFIAVKLGDVNGSANPQLKPAVIWTVNDQLLNEGDIITVPFQVARFDDIASYQMALGFDPAQLAYMDVTSSGELDLTSDNFGAFDSQNGEFRAVWSAAAGQTIKDGKSLFSLRFKVLEGGLKLSDVLTMDEQALEARAFTTDLAEAGMVLLFNEAQVSGTSSLAPNNGLSLLQNRPNPFTDQTVIGFVLPAACDAQLRIFDINGQLITAINQSYTAGYQQEIIRLEGQTGVLYYELTTPFGTLSKKMVVVK